jgi:hypothetical protein
MENDVNKVNEESVESITPKEQPVVEQPKVEEPKVDESKQEVSNSLDDDNEFASLDTDDESAPEQEYVEEVENEKDPTVVSNDEELGPKDFNQGTYIKSPDVDKSIIIVVEKIVKNTKTTGKNRKTGKTFIIGMKKKDGEIMRRDIITSEGRYTIPNWEIFYKLLGSDGVLRKYGEEHNTFKNAKVKITKHYNAQWANFETDVLAKVIGKTVEEAELFKEEISTALKEKKLYTVELVTE